MAVQRAEIDQAAAGTTEIVAAPGAGYHIEVVGYLITVSPAGTYEFKSATTGLTGQVAQGLTAAPVMGSEDAPVLICAANEALNVTTVTGSGEGYVLYTIES